MIAPGIYTHYKGNDYLVLGVATHEESHEPLVVYRALYGDYVLWARPLSVFMEEVEVEGRTIPRFQFKRVC